MGLLSTVGSLAGTYFGGPAGGAVGGLIGGALEGGASTAGGMQQASAAQQAAQQAARGAQFRPIGMTNTFGTSDFKYDPTTGQLTGASYSLAPQLQGYQTQLAGMTGQGLQAGQGLMNLGQQYIGESPEAVRQRYIDQQNALLAPGNEQAYAQMNNKLFQTGRGGLATGATTAGGMAATNPEMAAYYNSLAKQQAQLAAGAEQAAQQQVTYGQGLLNNAYQPFNAGLSAQQGVEALGQNAYNLSTGLGTSVANAGNNAGRFTASPAAAYSPSGTLLSALGNASAGLLGSNATNGLNPLTGNAFGWTTGSSVIPQSTFTGSGDASWMSDAWM